MIKEKAKKKGEEKKKKKKKVVCDFDLYELYTINLCFLCKQLVFYNVALVVFHEH